VIKKRRYFIWIAASVALILAVLFINKDHFQPLRIRHIELVKLPSNRLRFEVNVNASKTSDAYLEYWAKGSRDTLYSKVSREQKKHQLFISAARPRTAYEFRIITRHQSEQARSKVYSFETEPIYQATPYFSLEESDPSIAEDLKNKYFLTQILTEPGSVVILDSKGDIVWYEPFQKGVKVSHWTKDKTVICIVGPEKIPSSGGDEIVEMGLDGKVITHLKKGVGDMDKLVHHEVRKDEEGNIYAMTFTKKIADLSSVKGKVRDTINGDGIVMFNKSGKKIWEWSVLDHLDPLKDPQILKNKKDWVHGNAVFRLENGDFLVSFRDLNQIWKVEYKTGKVLWKFGEKGDFSMKPDLIFHTQHYIHPTPEKNFMLLDNGDEAHITRAMIFDLDTLKMTADPVNVVTLPPDYYTTAKGSAALFGKNKDKVLFCLTDPRSFLITDMKGKILWRIQVGGDPYRLEEISDFLYEKPTI